MCEIVKHQASWRRWDYTITDTWPGVGFVAPTPMDKILSTDKGSMASVALDVVIGSRESIDPRKQAAKIFEWMFGNLPYSVFKLFIASIRSRTACAPFDGNVKLHIKPAAFGYAALTDDVYIRRSVERMLLTLSYLPFDLHEALIAEVAAHKARLAEVAQFRARLSVRCQGRAWHSRGNLFGGGRNGIPKNA